MVLIAFVLMLCDSMVSPEHVACGKVFELNVSNSTHASGDSSSSHQLPKNNYIMSEDMLPSTLGAIEPTAMYCLILLSFYIR